MYYHDLNTELRTRFGCKLYKLALPGGSTCPNRDGVCGTRGCIFCDGAGAFAAQGGTTQEQLALAKARVAAKAGPGAGYIAYFQSFTATYAPVQELERRFTAALRDPEVRMLSIATRPDCLPDEVLRLLETLRQEKPVMVELGLQTVHEDTARFLRRGYALPVFDEAMQRLRQAGLETVVHLILGLPGESAQDMEQSAAYVGRAGADGVKLHLLHVLRGTDLAALYQEKPFPLPTLPEYTLLLERCLEVLPRSVVIHRLTGDGAKRDLIAPAWSADKKRVLNAIQAAFRRDNLEQGRRAAQIRT